MNSRFPRSSLGKILYGVLIVNAAILRYATPHEVGLGQGNPFEQPTFGSDWAVLDNDIFFGGAQAMFGLSPASRNLLFSAPLPPSKESESVAFSNTDKPAADLFYLASGPGAPFFAADRRVLSPLGPAIAGTPTASAGLAPAGPFSIQAVVTTWVGPGSGSWGVPSNWNPAVVPNAAGEIAVFTPTVANTTAMLTFENVASGVTVGTLSLLGTGAQGWTIIIDDASPFTFDNNGDGATLSNENTAVGSHLFIIAGGGIVLADDLNVTNTSGSTSPDGSILLSSRITGTGNIVFNNVSNTFNAGQIRILSSTPASTFSGSSTIASGAVSFSGNSAFGRSINAVNLGSPGGGAATLIGTQTGSNLPNPILVSSGSGGTLLLGYSSASSTTNSTFSGPIGLSGDVFLTSSTTGTAAVVFSSIIFGAGGVTKVGTGTVRFTGDNSFSGETVVNNGRLELASLDSLGGTSSVTVNSGGTLLFSGATNNRVKNTAELVLNGNGSPVISLQTAGLSEHGATNNTAGIGPVTLQSSSIIDLGDGASVIAFANSLTKSWTGTLSIYNWTGNLLTGNGTDQVYFGTDITGLSALQLSQINFYSGSGTGFLGIASWGSDFDGEIVPVPIPEASTWIGGALVLGALCFSQRRRLQRR